MLAPMTTLHTEKCCHLASEHETSAFAYTALNDHSQLFSRFPHMDFGVAFSTPRVLCPPPSICRLQPVSKASRNRDSYQCQQRSVHTHSQKLCDTIQTPGYITTTIFSGETRRLSQRTRPMIRHGTPISPLSGGRRVDLHISINR